MRWNPAPSAVPAGRALPRTASELALLLPGVAGFAALAVLVRAKRTEAADLAISLRVQTIEHPVAERAMAVVSWFGFPPQSRLIPPGIAAALWLGRARLEAAMLVGAWGSALVSTVIKVFMRRPRPVAGTDLRVVAAQLGGSSFPSGHVLTYTVVYGWLAVVADVLIRPDRARRLGRRWPRHARRGRGTEPDPPRPPLAERRDRVVSAGLELPRGAGRGVSTTQGRRRDPVTGIGAPAPRRIRVLWNASSGRKAGIATSPGTDEAALRELLARHGLGDELIATASEEEAVAATREAARDGYDVVVGAGGDGTIGTVGRELLGTDTALGALPLGSIMNIPRMLGIPRELEGAAEVLAEGHLRRIDVGDIDGDVFFEAGSVGFHAAIFREAARMDAGDRGAIWRSIVAAFRYRPSWMELELVGADGEASQTIATRALLVVVANGPFMGAGFTVAPDASLEDGLLDVRVFRHFSKRELIRHFVAIAFGRRAYAPHTDTLRAVHVTVRGHRPLPARADAVDLGHTPVTFGVRAGSLLVVAPPPAGSGSPDEATTAP